MFIFLHERKKSFQKKEKQSKQKKLFRKVYWSERGDGCREGWRIEGRWNSFVLIQNGIRMYICSQMPGCVMCGDGIPWLEFHLIKLFSFKWNGLSQIELFNIHADALPNSYYENSWLKVVQPQSESIFAGNLQSMENWNWWFKGSTTSYSAPQLFLLIHPYILPSSQPTGVLNQHH